MDSVDLLLTRRSARALLDLEPSEGQLERILQAAMAAPDHGRLRPWRFIIVRGEARSRFGDLLADALRKSQPEVKPEALRREREKAFRAPLIIVVAARPHTSNKKIPEIEQVLSAGAAAQNIMLAAHGIGLGAMWKTGAAAYDESVKASLGLKATDQIVGFLYIGTQACEPPPIDRAKPESHVVVLAA